MKNPFRIPAPKPPKPSWRERLHWWINDKKLWSKTPQGQRKIEGLVVGAVVSCLFASLFGFLAWAIMSGPARRAGPCEQYVKGYVATTTPDGRAAFVSETWCAKYKPGREPKK